MKNASFSLLPLLFVFFSCTEHQPAQESPQASVNTYFQSTETGVKTGGIKVITIETPKGPFKVWTKTIGNNPKMRLLTLNGGPGLPHDYLECFESFLPAEGIELIYYDQLGC